MAAGKRPPPPPPLPPPPPEKPERPGKKPKKPRKGAGLTDRDLAILASWDSLTFHQKQEYRSYLSPDGLVELERRTSPGRLPPARVPVAAKTPADLRRDLELALKPKKVKDEIAKEADNRAVRKTDVTAWKGQYTAAMRHPRLIVQSYEEAARAAKAAHYPKRQKGTRYHATIIAITQHPPLAKYGPSTIGALRDLFVLYIAVPMATTPTQMRKNVADTIANSLRDLPGDAPMYIAAIEVRTSRKK